MAIVAAAARAVLRSAAASSRSATTSLSAGVKPRASGSPLRISSRKSLSARIFRSPVEMSCVGMMSMLPYQSATAGAVLNSMLFVAPCGHSWSIEGL